MEVILLLGICVVLFLMWLVLYYGFFNYDDDYFNNYKYEKYKNKYTPPAQILPAQPATVAPTPVAPAWPPLKPLLVDVIAIQGLHILKNEGTRVDNEGRAYVIYEDKYLKLEGIFNIEDSSTLSIAMSVRVGCEWRVVYKIEQFEANGSKDFKVVQHTKGGWEESVKKLFLITRHTVSAKNPVI